LFAFPTGSDVVVHATVAAVYNEPRTKMGGEEGVVVGGPAGKATHPPTHSHTHTYIYAMTARHLQ